jgi:vacuolar-type H+-ATPase subunit F/Vma7
MISRILFISPLFDGSTSLMRLNALKSIFTSSCKIEAIDTQKIIDVHPRISQFLAYKYKTGPISFSISNAIKKKIKNQNYDLVWVEKGVLIQPNVIRLLRGCTRKLIHFTPDPAFYFHKSSKFIKSIKYYDLLVTTKSFEMDSYLRYIDERKLILVSQAYSEKIHSIKKVFKERTPNLVFIGHHESNRSLSLQKLIDNNIEVNLSGRGWDDFVNHNLGNELFCFIGEKLYGQDYVNTLNNYCFSVGFLSEWIPEKHTTRTFEIPACGCLLFTPRNDEIEDFFTDEEVVFYDNNIDLINKIRYYQSHLEEAEIKVNLCIQKLKSGDFTHRAIVQNIIDNIH